MSAEALKRTIDLADADKVITRTELNRILSTEFHRTGYAINLGRNIDADEYQLLKQLQTSILRGEAAMNGAEAQRFASFWKNRKLDTNPPSAHEKRRNGAVVGCLAGFAFGACVAGLTTRSPWGILWGLLGAGVGTYVGFMYGDLLPSPD